MVNDHIVECFRWQEINKTYSSHRKQSHISIEHGFFLDGSPEYQSLEDNAAM